MSFKASKLCMKTLESHFSNIYFIYRLAFSRYFWRHASRYIHNTNIWLSFSVIFSQVNNLKNTLACVYCLSYVPVHSSNKNHDSDGFFFHLNREHDTRALITEKSGVLKISLGIKCKCKWLYADSPQKARSSYNIIIYLILSNFTIWCFQPITTNCIDSKFHLASFAQNIYNYKSRQE